MFLEQEQIDRFWSKVDKSKDCWEWTAGSKNKEGYGGFYVKQINNTMNCHKISFMLAHNFELGDIPDGIVIRHECNNPKCVNPKHLKLGTCKDNSQDMVKAGNSMKGSSNPKALFNETQINEIRMKWMSGKYTCPDLEKEYKTNNSTIYNIVMNTTYVDDSYTPKKFNHSRKITKEQYDEIRVLKKGGVPVSQIAQIYNIGSTQVYNIIRKEV